MTDLRVAVAGVRDAVCAILRVHQTRPLKQTPKRVRPAQFSLGFAGSGFGIVDDRYVVTAYHVLNDGQPRVAGDRYYAFVVPNNGPVAYHFPVVGFPVEEPKLDIAVLEVGPCATAGYHIRSVPISDAALADGTAVLTYGFPAPAIGKAGVDPQGNYLGGEFFLKGHANEGIVAGQFDFEGGPMIEFNVGWFNGESGGPVFSREPLAAIAVMKSYRGIQAKHGIVPGPHAARPLAAVKARLVALGGRAA